MLSDAVPLSDAQAPVPSRRSRLLIGLLVGVLAAAFAWWQHGSLLAEGREPDSLVYWRAARIVMAGGDPYGIAALNSAPAGETDSLAWRTSMREPLYYPLPAIWLWVPFAAGKFLTGTTAFAFLSGFGFAYAVTRRGLMHAMLCVAPPFIWAIRFGQWSPVIAAAYVYPMIGFVTPMKPNLGLGVVAARPGLPMLIGPAVALVLATIVQPSWLPQWLHHVTGPMGQTAPHPIPALAFHGAGVLLLCALARWRTEEARLLTVMACVPQLPVFADQLLLGLVARSRLQVLSMVLASWIGLVAWLEFAPSADNYVSVIQPYVLVSTYLPALLVVLIHPNAGDPPAWWIVLRRRLARAVHTTAD